MAKRYSKKNSSLGQRITQLKYPPEIRIQPVPDLVNRESMDALLQLLSSSDLARPKTGNDTPNPQLLDLLRILTELATGIWRTRQKMLVPGENNEPREEMRRVFRPLDAAYQNMIQAGMEIVDRTNQPYITGLPEKVIAFEPTRGINSDTVVETIKPTILYQSKLLQLGEIIVGTPNIQPLTQLSNE